MPIAGTAEVIVTAVTDRLEAGIRSGLDRAAADAESSGASVGDSFGTGFEDSSNKHYSNILSQMKMGLAAGGEAEGEKFGENITQGISHGLGATDRELFGGLENESRLSGQRVGANIDQGVRDGMQSAEADAAQGGDNIGRAVSDGVKSAGSFGDWFGILKIGALVAAIGLAAGAIANLVAGLFAMAAAAAPAVASLAALLPILGGLVATAGVGYLAFSGIFKALSALNTQQAKTGAGATSLANATQAAADRVHSANEAVAAAQIALANAYQQAADDRVNADHQVQDAEYSLAQAQQAAKQAQIDLTQARVDARSALVNLQLQLRGAVLGEQQAALSLTEAQQAYQQTLINPAATAQQKQQALLNLEQAELALDQAKKNRQDVATQDAAANKKGVEGSDQVVQAKKRESDANHTVAEDEYNLARLRHSNAEQAVADQQRIASATQSLADAQHSLTEALQAQKQALAGGASSANAATQALNKLTPAARAFAEFLFGLKPKFDELKAAADGMFAPLRQGINDAINNLLPSLKHEVSITATALGNAFKGFSDNFLATPLFRGELKKLFAANAQGLGDLGRVFTNLANSFTQLAVDAIPLAKRFTDWILSITKEFANFVSAKSIGGNESPIAKFFKMAGDRAALLGDIIKQIIRVFYEWGRGAQASGVSLLQTFDNVTKRFADGLGSKEGQARLHAFFAEVEPGFKALASLAGAILGAFISLATSPGLKTVADGLRTQLLPVLQQVIQYLNTNIVPKIVPVFADIGRLVTNIVHSGVLQTVVSDLVALFHAIANIAASPIFRLLIGHLGHLFAAFIAFKLFQKFSPIDEIAKSIGLLKGGLSGAVIDTEKAAKGYAKVGLAIREMRLANAGAALSKTDLLTVGVSALKGKVTGPKTLVEGPLFPGQTRLEFSAAINAISDLESKGTIFERIFSKIGGVLAGVGEALSGVSLPFVAVGVAIAAVIGSFIYAYKTSAQVRDNIKKIFEGIKEAVLAFVGPIIKVVEPAFIHLANAIGIHGKDIKQVMSSVGDIIRKVWIFITDAFVKAMPIIKTVMGIFGQIIATEFQIAIDIIKVAIAVIKETIIVAWTVIRDVVIPIVKFIWDTVGTMFRVGIAVVTVLVTGVRDLITGAWKFISDTILPIAKAIWDYIKAGFQAEWDFIKGILDLLKDIFTGHWSNIKTDVENIVGNLISDIEGMFKALPGKILAFLGDIASAGLKLATGLFNGFWDLIKTLPDKLISFFGSLPSKLAGLVGTLFGIGVSLGESMLKGINKAFNAGVGFIGDLAKSIADAVIHWLAGHFGIHLGPPTTEGGIPGAPKPGFLDPHKSAAAAGGTFLPKPGGTLVQLAEAGRAETVVDTATLHAYLSSSGTAEAMTAGKLDQVIELLRGLQGFRGLNIENINATTSLDEPVAVSVPRALRSLAFELGA